MRFKQIVERVRERGGLKDREEAERVLRAVLGTLGERVYRAEQHQMAAQLPKELRPALDRYQGPERGRDGLSDYTLEEFYNRVSARARISHQDAQRQTKTVLSVLQEAVSPGEIADVMGELPDEFQSLFVRERPPAAATPPPPAPAPPATPPEEYHVIPGGDGTWSVRRGTNGESLRTFKRKEQAIFFADDIADAERGDVLVIHDIDGSVSRREAPTRVAK